MKKSEIEKKTEELLQPILEAGNYDLWDVDYVKEGKDFYLRVYVDKEGGLNITDCVEISHALDPKLDEEDFIEDAYTLEVSSPGLTRKLVKDREIGKSIGRQVFAKLYTAVEGQKEFAGVLASFDGDTVSIQLTEDHTVTLNRDNLALLRLEYVEEAE